METYIVRIEEERIKEKRLKNRIYSRKYREKHPEKIREYERTHKKESSERHKKRYLIVKKRILKKGKEWRQNNKLKRRVYAKEDKKRNPLAYKCRTFANNHLKIKVNDRCLCCGTSEKLEKHHPDYNKPTRILILCNNCHNKLHSLLNEAKEPNIAGDETDGITSV